MVSYCPKCATKVIATDARFCTSCGAKFPSHESENEPQPAKPKKRLSGLVVAILVVLFVGAAAGPVIFASQGLLPNPKDSGPLVIWGAIVFYALFRYYGKRGWLGSLFGFAIASCILVTANVIARKSDAYVLAHTAPYPAIKKFDPVAFERIESTARELSKDPAATDEIKTAKLAPLIVPVFLKALPATTNEALQKYANLQVAHLEEVSRVDSKACAAMVMGQMTPELAAQTKKYLSKPTSDALVSTMTLVIEGAASKEGYWEIPDQAFQDILDKQIEPKLTPLGLSLEYLNGNPFLLPEKVCRSGIHLYREVLKLDDSVRFGALRKLVGG